MKPQISRIAESVLGLLRDGNPEGTPRKIIEQQLENQSSLEMIRDAILHLLNSYVIDLTIDYPPKESGIYDGRPVCHLKLLTDEASQSLRALTPLAWALLKILRQKNDSRFPGEIPVEDAKAVLRREGFEDEDVEWLWIENRVDRIRTTRAGKLVPCFRIIPEYEKTEEYKSSQEEAHREWEEREAFRMRMIEKLEKEDEARERRRQKRKKAT